MLAMISKDLAMIPDSVKIIQITTTKLRSEHARDRVLLIALCDDGSIWQRYAYDNLYDSGSACIEILGVKFNPCWTKIE